MFHAKPFLWDLASIMKSKNIVLMAYGKEKAEAVKGMIEGEVTVELPASILQNT
jgi:glucosamine-6-phosphate deaminase